MHQAAYNEHGHVGLRQISSAVFLIALILAPVRLALAEPVVEGGIEVSGYFDIQAVSENAAVRDNDFKIGQAVIELSRNLSDRWTADLDFSYNRAEEIEIDKAFATWNVFRWDGHPRRQSLGVVEADFVVGRFDVPFGIDWRVYASVDRRLVSVPVVVANTHRGWNDVGVMFRGRTTWSNWAIYAVNGFDTSPLLSSQLTAGVETPLPTEAYGARGGIIINDNFEFGTSFGAGYTDDNTQDQHLWSFDLTGRFTNLELKGEFISHQRYRNTAAEQTVYGYYVQGAWTEGSFFGVIRQDTYNPDGSMVESLGKVVNESILCTSFGGGYFFGPHAQLRGEYRLAEGSSNDTVFLQTAVSF